MARSYPSWIAGLRYTGPDGTNRGKYCYSLRPGTALSLVRELDNPHDETGLAVAIKHDGRHLGYVPSRHHWIGQALDEGKSLTCVIDRIEAKGWLFRRARFVGVTVTVMDQVRERVASPAKPPKPKRDKAAEAQKRNREHRARELCINGLRVLAHVALSDDDLSAAELAIQATYIETRLQSAGVANDPEIIETLLVTAQGLAVPRRGFVRALNAVATDRGHFALVLNATLKIAAGRATLNEVETAALERIQEVGKAKGWI